MPTEKTKNRDTPDANAVYVAVEGFAVESAGVPGEPVVRAGARLRGDHPLVKAAPRMFVVDGADDDEARERRLALHNDYLNAPRGLDHEPRFQSRRLRAEDAVVAVTGVPREQGGLTLADAGVAAGDRLAKSNPVVRKHPDAFVSVVPAGLTRERALVAKTTLVVEPDAEGRGRTVYAGQWIDRDDEVAKVHPHAFEMPAIEEEEAA